MVMFVSFVAFCWMSVRFLLTNQPIANLIQTALATVVTLILSIVSYFPPSLQINQTGGNNPASSENEVDAMRLMERR